VAAPATQSSGVLRRAGRRPGRAVLAPPRRICERWPDTRPRIIAMTANALPEDREACFAAGMDDYVARRIRPDALAEALKLVRPVSPEAPPRAEKAGGLLDGAAIESLRELGGRHLLLQGDETYIAG